MNESALRLNISPDIQVFSQPHGQKYTLICDTHSGFLMSVLWCGSVAGICLCRGKSRSLPMQVIGILLWWLCHASLRESTIFSASSDGPQGVSLENSASLGSWMLSSHWWSWIWYGGTSRWSTDASANRPTRLLTQLPSFELWDCWETPGFVKSPLFEGEGAFSYPEGLLLQGKGVKKLPWQ